jgi:uncharacterized membrane protein YagU involved in acid resistance
MATTVPLNWGRVLLSGILAGIAGGICIEAFVYLTSTLPAHHSILSLWQFEGSVGLGKVAFSSVSYAWIGLVLHFAAAIGWGIGYAYLANTQTAINKQPVVSGFLFGVVVYVVMQVVLYTVQELKIPDPFAIYLGILAATVFFGIPIAFVARVK